MWSLIKILSNQASDLKLIHSETIRELRRSGVPFIVAKTILLIHLSLNIEDNNTDERKMDEINMKLILLLHPDVQCEIFMNKSKISISIRNLLLFPIMAFWYIPMNRKFSHLRISTHRWFNLLYTLYYVLIRFFFLLHILRTFCSIIVNV